MHRAAKNLALSSSSGAPSLRPLFSLRSLARFARSLFGVAVVCAASGARASPTFPAEIQKKLDMSCAPICTICHHDTQGGYGTAVKPFAQQMIDSGLVGAEPDRVGRALDAVEASGADSDGDGLGDVAELREERDPNVQGPGVICGPTYGCGARVAPRGRLDPAALLAAFGVVLALGAWARRRRSAERSE